MIHVPFLPNFKGETAIDKCIEKKDYKSIDTILKYLIYYPTDHHSRAIMGLYGDLLEKGLPELLPYIESRFQQTEQTAEITKGCLKQNTLGIITSDLWFQQKDFDNKLIEEKPVETRIKCEIIDLPGCYHYMDDEFKQFF